MQLEQLVYVSRARSPARRLMEVSDILDQSIRNNVANNITGALTFTDTRFIQILEGSHGSLDVLLLKLLMDPRHFDMVVIDRVAITARTFGDWDMVASHLTDETRDSLEAMLSADVHSIEAYAALMLRIANDQKARVATSSNSQQAAVASTGQVAGQASSKAS